MTDNADDGTPNVKAGMYVRIPKGATIRTMHPSRDHYVLKRAQTVKVNHTLGGYPASDYYPAVPLSVRWPGTGGYWCEATEFVVVSPNDGKEP